MPDIGSIVLLAVAVLLVSIIAIRHPEKLRPFFTNIRAQAGNVFITLPFGLLIAAFVSRMLPADVVAALIGKESGLTGVLVASALGGFIPGGPMVAFPIAYAIFGMGAGQAQMISLLTSWSVFTVHRILTYELPLMGQRFVTVRLIAVSPLPFLAAALATAAIEYGWFNTQ